MQSSAQLFHTVRTSEQSSLNMGLGRVKDEVEDRLRFTQDSREPITAGEQVYMMCTLT